MDVLDAANRISSPTALNPSRELVDTAVVTLDAYRHVPPYRETEEGIIWDKPSRDGTLPTLLTYFRARLAAENTLDDGAKESRHFTLCTAQRGRHATYTIPAARFPGMGWVPECMGITGIINPGNAMRDHAVFAVGPTGCGKSQLGALAQQHFGADMDAQHLPGSWSSTCNSLEAMAFTAKDVILVIDDFAPYGTQSDVQKLHASAERLLRAQGNGSCMRSRSVPAFARMNLQV